MKKHEPMNKLEFMMAVEQLGGWRAVQAWTKTETGAARRVFGSEDDYTTFLYYYSYMSVMDVEPRTSRSARRKRPVTDARAGRW